MNRRQLNRAAAVASNDNQRNTPDDFPVSGCGGRGHLLHSRDCAARHRSIHRRRRRRFDSAEDNRAVRSPRVVADTVCLNAIFRAHDVPRARHLVYANLSRYLASGPPLRLARTGGLCWHRSDHRSAAGLFVRTTFPKWMVFAPGVAPILADCAAYIMIVIVGHAVMRLVAGPARADRLARATA